MNAEHLRRIDPARNMLCFYRSTLGRTCLAAS